MTRPVRMIAVALATLLAIFSGGKAARAADDPATVIKAELEQWRLDFNARRDTRICDLFAPDLRYDFQGLPEQNHTLLCDRLHRALADRSKTFQYGLRIKEVLVSGDLAVVRLSWISNLTATDGRTTSEEEPGLDVFQRQPDGSWKIIRYIAYPATPG